MKKRAGKDFELAAQAEALIHVTHDDVARKVSDPKQKAVAKRLAAEAVAHERIASNISSSRNVVNFLYWRNHAATEQQKDVIDAREFIYKGDRAFAEGDLDAAYKFYQQGLVAWRKVLDTYKDYLADQVTCEDLVDMIRRYRHILSQRDETIKEPFILQDAIDSYMRQTGGSAVPLEPIGTRPKDKSKSPTDKKAGEKKDGS